MRRKLSFIGGAGLSVALVVGLIPLQARATEVPAPGCSAVSATGSLESAFSAAAEKFDVNEDVLKGISYMQSRWDGHDGAVSADGGYGMFNILDHSVTDLDGSGKTTEAKESSSALDSAAELTGLDADLIKSDDFANICAGAALLADYASEDADPADPVSYGSAISRFGSDEDFAANVLDTVKTGASRTIAGQSVTLTAIPTLDVSEYTEASGENDPETDCPVGLGCEWMPAPYEKTDPDDADDTGYYGNHDTADRTGEGGPAIKYIVIHSTEGTYSSSVDLAMDKDYLAWNYTLRASDGYTAQHLDPKDIGWHAGNWYVNMHSIGVEHEGFAGTSGWFTESLYRNSAKLVKYLAEEYNIPIDRAHIIGHDQVPGVASGSTQSMHWDPGPYWDWDHYFELLGAPLTDSDELTSDIAAGDIVAVDAGESTNTQTLTGCSYLAVETLESTTGCATDAEVNYIDAYTAPSLSADKAYDPAQKLSGSQGVSTVSSRVVSGTKLYVADVQEDADGNPTGWIQTYWAGSAVWIYSPTDAPILQLTTGTTVTNNGTTPLSTYGRAYPEASAYDGTGVTNIQTISPLESSIGIGQTYVISADDVVTDYYNALLFDESAPGDRTDVVGNDVYYQIWFAHRQFFVKASGLTVTDADSNTITAVNTSLPSISGGSTEGSTLTADPGTWSRSSLTDFTYQWNLQGEAIDGATSSTFTTTADMVGKQVTVTVTTADTRFAVVSATSAPLTVTKKATSPTPQFTQVKAPVLSGMAKVGKTLTTTTGTWSPAGKTTVVWLRDGKPISGATGTKYKLTAKDYRKKISVKITVSKSGYVTKTATTAAKKVALGDKLKAKKSLKIVGTKKVGKTLKVTLKKSSFSPTADKLTYQWSINGKKVKGATSAKFTLTKKAKGKKVTVEVVAKKAGYSSKTLTAKVKVSKKK